MCARALSAAQYLVTVFQAFFVFKTKEEQSTKTAHLKRFNLVTPLLNRRATSARTTLYSTLLRLPNSFDLVIIVGENFKRRSR